jgi:2-keto-4-pentenoate hydratase/2-oxohepta-3-ene-1,7-dioic acid hydratase in catechol pathway
VPGGGVTRKHAVSSAFFRQQAEGGSIATGDVCAPGGRAAAEAAPLEGAKLFAPIPFDAAVSGKIGGEAELAVVIGPAGRDIAEADAMRHVSLAAPW